MSGLRGNPDGLGDKPNTTIRLKKARKHHIPMSDSTKIDVNSWLEEELYQQYMHNHSFVDPAWQSEFAADAPSNGTATAVTEAPAPAPAPAPVVTAPAATPEPAPVAAPLQTQEMTKTESSVQTSQPGSKDVDSSEQLVPLRGTALRIAENMILSLSVPTATSQRSIPVKVIDENPRPRRSRYRRGAR